LDDLDRRILNAVQRDATGTMEALSELVGSTAATCHRRLRRLQRDGVVRAIVALVDAKRSDEPLTVLLGVRMSGQSSEQQRQLRRFMKRRSEIKNAWMTTGQFDYVLIAAFADMDRYLEFLEKELQQHPEIETYQSFVSLDEVKFETGRVFGKQVE
jgi:Lrp/AsnC family leucine-responsive transcriptional regulator